MTLGEIIKSYRDSHGMSMDAFAQKSGISKAYIHVLEKNKHPKTGAALAPSIEVIQKAAVGLSMDFNELFNMLDCEVTLNSEPQGFKTIKIPVFYGVAAGVNGIIMDSGNIDDYIDIPEDLAKTGEFFGYKIRGDSMEPEFRDGDIVVVRRQDAADNGKTVIVVVNGEEGFCKRLSIYADSIALVSNNPAYKPMYFSSSEIETLPVRIVGVVKQLVRFY